MFKRKKTLPTYNERIEEAKGKLESAQIMFVQARDEVEEADGELDEVISIAHQEIAKLQNVVDNAIVNKEKNEKFKNKLKEFIDLD